MEDFASLIFYLVVGLIWVLSSIFGSRTNRRREWEFPAPQAPEPEAPSKPQRPPVERIPARWRGQPEPLKIPRPARVPVQPRPTPAPARAAVGSTLTSMLKGLLATAEETTTAPEPLLEEPMPLLFDTDDLERGVIASEILGPPLALRARYR